MARLRMARKFTALAAAVASAALVWGACVHGGPATNAETRQLPSCPSCHEGGPRLKDQPPGLCRQCHGAAHGAMAEAAKQGAPGATEPPRCLTCHDVHDVHGRKSL